MAYKPMVYFRPIGTPEGCTSCPSARAVTAACAAALEAMKKNEYDEPPSHARKDQGCWVPAAKDKQLRQTDPTYTELATAHETAILQRRDIKEKCPGGTVDRPPQGSALHNCAYVPSPGVPELPVPPGILPLESGK